MENYLMSSPTQLNIDYSDINIDLYNLDIPDQSHKDKPDEDHHFSGSNALVHVNPNALNNLSNYDHLESASIGPQHSDHLDQGFENSTRFYNSKNVALNEPFYDSQYHGYHQPSLSISSIVSVGQDPPAFSNTDRIAESTSIESIPPLTASISNHSLSDSPSSLKKNPQSLLTTPRRITRNKSLSIGSYNLATPFRATSPGPNSAKVAKKTHSRSLSRSKNLNPFYTPNSFISPKIDSLENDEFGTPLQTPSTNLAHFSNQYLSPHVQPQVPILRRQNTLDSIKIEDQDDDAFKQLKRAKSFNNINHNDQFKQLPSSYSSTNIQLLQSQFKKSYPASINLASMTKEEKTNGLLPPMATFNHESDLAKDHHQNWSQGYPSGNYGVAPSGINTAESSPPPSRINSAGTHLAGNSAQPIPSNSILPSFVPDLPIKIKETTTVDPKKKHACPLCLARFQRPEHVKRHMKSHSSEKPFECDEPNCGKRFNRKDNLKAHLKKIHHR